MKKLTGYGAQNAARRPHHVKASDKATEIAIATGGRAERRPAIAAGVTRSAKTSKTPTICAAVATATASTSMKPIATPRTGTPRACADSGSIDAKSSGRYSTPTPASATADAITVTA